MKNILILITILGTGCISQTIYTDRNSYIQNEIVFDKKTNRKCNGILKRYHKTGQLYLEVPLKNGVNHGIQTFYKPSGEIDFQSVYQHGKRIKTLQGKNNQIIFSKTMEPEVTHYFNPETQLVEEVQDDNTCTPTNKIFCDLKTKLGWQIFPSNNYFSWNQAQNYCSNLNYGGYSNWRVPTIYELDHINQLQENINVDIFNSYWSSTFHIDDPFFKKSESLFGQNGAWKYKFSRQPSTKGVPYHALKSMDYSVICVKP